MIQEIFEFQVKKGDRSFRREDYSINLKNVDAIYFEISHIDSWFECDFTIKKDNKYIDLRKTISKYVDINKYTEIKNYTAIIPIEELVVSDYTVVSFDQTEDLRPYVIYRIFIREQKQDFIGRITFLSYKK